MFKNKVDANLKKAGYTYMKNDGLLIYKCFVCPSLWSFVLDDELAIYWKTHCDSKLKLLLYPYVHAIILIYIHSGLCC